MMNYEKAEKKVILPGGCEAEWGPVPCGHETVSDLKLLAVGEHRMRTLLVTAPAV